MSPLEFEITGVDCISIIISGELINSGLFKQRFSSCHNSLDTKLSAYGDHSASFCFHIASVFYVCYCGEIMSGDIIGCNSINW